MLYGFWKLTARSSNNAHSYVHTVMSISTWVHVHTTIAVNNSVYHNVIGS